MNDRYPELQSPLRAPSPLHPRGTEDGAGRAPPPGQPGRRLSDGARTALVMAAVCAGSIAFGVILAFALGGH